MSRSAMRTDAPPPGEPLSRLDRPDAASRRSAQAATPPPRPRRLPMGAEPFSGDDGPGVHFRVWAPKRTRVEVVVENAQSARTAVALLQPEGDGYFSGELAGAGAGALYRYLLDGQGPYPDPASRFQPSGPFGPSMVVDPDAFAWTDNAWPGPDLAGAVIYEMHVGTFTQEGTWRAAARQLPELAALGVTILEIMPLADFPGRFGWGYDGVDLYAPTRLYGEPDDVRRFVNAAHGQGLAVILDVVCNHFGPDGMFWKEFSDDWFTDRYENDWGEAINFDGERAAPVREFFIANAVYWIREFHFDGLRFDATQAIFDASGNHILGEMVQAARQAARPRRTYMVAENEPQHVRLVRPLDEGGRGLDGLWNDDFHHTAMVALTGQTEAYYMDYGGTPQEFISCAKRGYLYQGQWYAWQKQRRGAPTHGVSSRAFVNFIQNHDQIANTARGERCDQLSTPGRLRAMTALMLLMPGTPMLFMGQEFCASQPFLYFADHKPELAAQVRKGRAEFLAQFRRISLPEIRERLANPGGEDVFRRCKLDFAERARHRERLDLHRDLIGLRRTDSVFAAAEGAEVEGAVIGPDAFVLRYPGRSPDGRPDRVAGGGPNRSRDRLLVVNFGRDLHLTIAPEPLLAPPENSRWTPLWSSEDPRYGGAGTPPLDTDSEDNWRVPSDAAVVLAPSSIPAPAKEARP